MRIAIPNGGAEDGVKLFSNQRTPFPANAIHPVSNWDSISVVPEKYRVVDNGSVREMTDEEKKVVDNAMLPDLKLEKNKAIDAKTSDLISEGIEYPDGSGNIFSMSLAAQKNIIAFKGVVDSGADIYPIKITIKDSDGLDDEYTFDDEASFNSFYSAAFTFVQSKYDSGRALKIQVKAASDIDELNAVVDDR